MKLSVCIDEDEGCFVKFICQCDDLMELLWCDLDSYLCHSTATCKALLNRPHSKLGQYYADSLPNLDEHIIRRCESNTLL